MSISPANAVTTKVGSRSSHSAPAFFLLCGLVLVVLPQSDFFRAIPGDLGDARLNNLILEHLYRWAIGKDSSLWSPGFFYPYPGTLSFSDNHFGTIIIYALLRQLGLSPDHAFIGWFTAAAPLNFLCCYHALRKGGLTDKGSAVGAFIFAFALTASIQSQHAQLNYRFAIPLAMLAWQRFVNRGNALNLAAAVFWLTIQFYCSIYLGYFLILLLCASFCALYAVRQVGEAPQRPHRVLYDIIRNPRTSNLFISVAIIVGCIAALTVLLYPYLYYSRLYGFHRSREEIASMLPRLWSYFIADNSRLWGTISTKLPDVPMRNEQQMFFGLGAILLALIGCMRNSTLWTRNALISLALLVLITLSVRNHSLYYQLTNLPVANAIRAVSRIGLVMLFPVGVLAGSGFDWLVSPAKQTFSLPKSLTCFLLTLLMLVEYTTLTTGHVNITDWRNHISVLKNDVPANLPGNSIVFFPLRNDTPLFMSELDGMSLAQTLGVSTLNGYSGNAPMGFYDPNATPCDQAVERLAGYASFAKLSKSNFDELVNRVVTVGEPTRCLPPALLSARTHFSGALPVGLIHQMSVIVESIALSDGRLSVELRLNNGGNEPLPSLSDTNQPIRASWRIVDLASPPGLNDDWSPRKDLTSDVPAHGSQQIHVTIAAPGSAGKYKLQASVVQDGVVWFHNAGMQIATSDQTIEVGANGTTTISK